MKNGPAALVQLGCLHAPTGCAFLLFWFNVLNSSSAQKEGLDSKLARTISLVVIMLELTGGTPVHAHWQCNGSCSLWCHAWRTPFSSSFLERTRNTASIGLNRNFALELVALQSCYTVGALWSHQHLTFASLLRAASQFWSVKSGSSHSQ